MDVAQTDFETQVLERSREVPVVVDFWAGWCRPCLVLGPMLEKLSGEYGDRFVLAKVDVDANPALASAFGVQGIPAVKAFRDGRVVSEFVGAQPEEVVRRFLDQVAPDTARLEPARKAEESGALDEAEAAYREALEANPGDEEAALGLARVLLDAGQDLEEARTLLSRIPGRAEAVPLLAEVDLRELSGGTGEAAAAAREALAGDADSALERLLAVVSSHADGDDEARQTMIAIFDLLGDDDPRTRDYRPRLAKALF